MTDSNLLSSKDLSRYWYCTDDKTRLRPKTERVAQNAVFKIIRDKLDTSVSNALAIRKIPQEAVESTTFVANYIFEHSDLHEIELVGTECPSCLKRYASPKMNKVDDLPGVNIGRALYDNQKKLDTKYYGRFRFVNKFGLGWGGEQGQGQGRMGGMRGLFLLGWFIGFFYIFAVIILYYIVGMEVKFRDRFYPIGWLLIVGILLGVLIILVEAELLSPIWDLISSFGRGRR